MTTQSPATLEQLLTAVRAGQYNDEQMVELPSFGGDEPASTSGVWSWDATRLMIGTCASDMKLVARADYARA